jgi:hypothetical protein
LSQKFCLMECVTSLLQKLQFWLHFIDIQIDWYFLIFYSIFLRITHILRNFRIFQNIEHSRFLWANLSKISNITKNHNKTYLKSWQHFISWLSVRIRQRTLNCEASGSLESVRRKPPLPQHLRAVQWA